jgi:hypothetical protein
MLNSEQKFEALPMGCTIANAPVFESTRNQKLIDCSFKDDIPLPARFFTVSAGFTPIITMGFFAVKVL